MLRALVVLLLLVNVALYAWLRANPQALQPDREPQRLQHQVSPDAIQVLPDLPTPAAAPTAAVASASPPASAAALGASAGEIDGDCAETPPLNNDQFAALTATLIQAGVPADEIAERRQLQGGSWIAYLGRFTDSKLRQQRADELNRLNLQAEHVDAPPALAPGLSLGRFSSKADAVAGIEALIRQGVHGARVVVITPPAVQRHLQVHAPGQAWRRATGTQQFDACRLDAANAP